MLCCLCTLADPESRRYRNNWIVIYTLNSLLGVSYFIGIPSLHQFVTSSSSPQDPNVSWFATIVYMCRYVIVRSYLAGKCVSMCARGWGSNGQCYIMQEPTLSALRT